MTQFNDKVQELIWMVILTLIFTLFIVFLVIVTEIFTQNEVANPNGLVLTLLKGGD